jgi:hypothetical protein
VIRGERVEAGVASLQIGYVRCMSRADDLATMTVLDETKTAVTLGTLWRAQPAILVFVRHFG